jgi:predicted  nucleic acid-binding Zn-ribbon protein
MITALNSGGLSFGSYQQIALDSMVNRAAEALQKKQTKLTETYEKKSDAITKESDRLVKLSSNVKNAEVAIDNGMDGLDEIESLLSKMRASLGEIERTDSEYERQQFDEYLRELNNVADRYSTAFNPIGKVQDRSNWTPNDISYNPDFTGNDTTLNGVYAGADFRIEDENGTIWIPDLSSQTLTEYTSYNTQTPADSDATGRGTSTTTGITAVSDPDANGNQTFTMIINGEETTVTGKLVKGGLGLTGKWNYNNFATPDDISAALKDLNSASAKLDIARSQMTTNAQIVQGHTNALKGKQDDLKGDMKDALYKNLESMTDLEREYNQQVAAMQQNLEAMSSQQQAYLSVFKSAMSGAGNNPLFVDMNV